MKINFSKISLVSSNEKKLKEYEEFGLPLKISKDIDLKEVDGSAIDVIIHKALAAGVNKLVEDVSLHVQGIDVGVNVRWINEEVKKNPKFQGKKSTWTVMLGLLYNEKVYIAEGIVEGIIDQTHYSKDSFGFDSVFVPKGSKKSLHQLKEEGKKNLFSARKKAINNLLNSKFFKIIKQSEVPKWEGSYQNE